jgi:Fis family transcriptional regulator
MSLNPSPVTQDRTKFAPAQAKSPQPLGDAVRNALKHYFEQLEGTAPSKLYQMVLEEVELPLFESALAHTGGNQTRAAMLLGISRSTLRKKLAQYEIE